MTFPGCCLSSTIHTTITFYLNLVIQNLISISNKVATDFYIYLFLLGYETSTFNTLWIKIGIFFFQKFFRNCLIITLFCITCLWFLRRNGNHSRKYITTNSLYIILFVLSGFGIRCILLSFQIKIQQKQNKILFRFEKDLLLSIFLLNISLMYHWICFVDFSLSIFICGTWREMINLFA